MPSDAPTIPKSPSRTRWLLYLILFVAALARLMRLDLMPFEMDEGAACILAVKFTHYGIAPLTGVRTSLQFCNPPLFLYLITPALWVTTDPRLAAMLFALLGTAAVYVVYRTGREFFSPAVGLLAAAMMAVSPAAIDYSRRLWGHSLIQALAPVAFYFLLRWTVGGRAKAIFWLALIVAAAQQLHFSAALWWVAAALAWWILRPRTDGGALIAGLALGLLGYLPFFIEQGDNGFADLKIIGQAIYRGTGQPWTFSARPLFYWFCAATDLGHNNWLQDDFGAFVAQIPFYRVTRAMAGMAWVGALAACAVAVARGRRRGVESSSDLSFPASALSLPALLLLWSLVPLAAFLSLRAPVVAPYFLVVYPAPFLAIAWLAVEIWQRTDWPPKIASIRRGVQGLVALLIGAWMVHQAVYNVALLVRLDREGGGKGSYVNFGLQRAAMNFIAQHALGRTVVVSEEHLDPGKGVDFRYYYLLWTFDHDLSHFFPRDREKAEYWYVIRNVKYRIRPDFDAFLAQYPCGEFGPLRVYVIPRPGPWPTFGLAPPKA